MSAPGPLPGSYWVESGRLMAGKYPADKFFESETRRRIGKLLDAGITSFFDLTQEGELGEYAPLLSEEAGWRDVQASHRRFAIPDFSTPSRLQMRVILNALDAALTAGEMVYVHCWGGVGRTGTVIGCHLVRHGLSGAQALARIAELRGDNLSPETDEQRSMVLHWKENGLEP